MNEASYWPSGWQLFSPHVNAHLRVTLQNPWAFIYRFNEHWTQKFRYLAGTSILRFYLPPPRLFRPAGWFPSKFTLMLCDSFSSYHHSSHTTFSLIPPSKDLEMGRRARRTPKRLLKSLITQIIAQKQSWNKSSSEQTGWQRTGHCEGAGSIRRLCRRWRRFAQRWDGNRTERRDSVRKNEWKRSSDGRG